MKLDIFRNVKTRINIWSVILLGILCLSAILRFYHIEQWLFFGMDQEYEALLIKNILSGSHFPLIGVNASDTGLYLGPLFIYFASIPYLLFKGNPLGGAVFASLMGVCVTYLIYLLGKRWYGYKTGLVASFIWAVSFIPVLYDRQFWNPTPIPLLSLLIYFALTNLNSGKIRFYILLGTSLGFALQSHLQAVVLFPVILFFFFQYRRQIALKGVAYFLILITLFQIPLLLFDIRHNFLNVNALKNLIISSISPGIGSLFLTSFSERILVLFTMIGRIFYIRPGIDLYMENGQCKELLPYIGKTSIGVILIGCLLLGYYLFRRLRNENKQLKDLKIPVYILVSTIFMLCIYKHTFYEYYFLYLLPIIILLISYSLSDIFQRNRKIFLITILFIIMFVSLHTILTGQMSYSFADKKKSIEFAARHIGSSDFYLDAVGGCGKYGGYRYLFEYFGKKPTASYMDEHFSWIYGEPPKYKITRKIIFDLYDGREGNTNLTNSYAFQDQQVIARAQFGTIRILVIDEK